MRIAHISDLHFSKISKGITQFFSKAWIGNLNLLFNRGYNFSPERPYALIEPLKQGKVTDIIVSGDLTTTSSPTEFQLAEQFIDKLKEEGFQVYLIPGNHDHYTKRAHRRQRFYKHFPSKHSSDLPYNLADHGVTAKKLTLGWWLVLMDTTLATPLKSSNGYFSEKTEASLKKLLQDIPPQDKVLLVNHFPFFQHDKPNRWLKRGTVLEELLQNQPKVQLFLHGHTHRRCVADLRENGLPIILDSGSTAYCNGSWNLLDIEKDACKLEVFSWEDAKWSHIETHNFRWKSE